MGDVQVANRGIELCFIKGYFGNSNIKVRYFGII